jgi:transcriptional regulator with XRE-family HTH domain
MAKLRNIEDAVNRGAKVRRIRMEKNLSLKKLAAKLGIVYQQVQKYETGANDISITAMKLIAAALEVPACEICGCCEVESDLSKIQRHYYTPKSDHK